MNQYTMHEPALATAPSAPAAAGSLRRWKQWVLRRLMNAHLAGPQLADALRIHHQAARCGWGSTLGYWSGPGDTPASAARCYGAAVEAIAGQSLDAYVSIKAPTLGYDFQLVKALLECAEPHGVRIHFDAMAPDSAEPTFELIERCLCDHRNVGCTLPSRWARSLEDAVWAAEMRIPVRVVKGQWPDPHHPKLDARAQYLAIIDRLSGRVAHVAVATHDRRLAQLALARLRDSGTPCEMEQISSLPQNCASLAKSLGIACRVYVPFGHPSLPFDIWQVRARPAILAWALRGVWAAHHRPLSR